MWVSVLLACYPVAMRRRVLVRLDFKRRGAASWVTVTRPDGREHARLLRGSVVERAEVWVRDGVRLLRLNGAEAERAWAGRTS